MHTKIFIVSAKQSKSKKTMAKKPDIQKRQRVKVRNIKSLENYIEGNSIIDWLVKHPDLISLQYIPMKITLPDLKGMLFNDAIVNLYQDSSLVKVLKDSEYATDTLIAMSEGNDIILNATLVDRAEGLKSKVSMLFKSTMIDTFHYSGLSLKDKLKMTRQEEVFSIYGDYYYVPVVIASKEKLDILTLVTANKILHKYQKIKPVTAFTATVKGSTVNLKNIKFLTETVNKTLKDGINWLEGLDGIDKGAEIGANAKISSDSPWCLAVKSYAEKQENSSMLPNVTCEDSLEWQTIDQAHIVNNPWADNYYSSTGANVAKFKDIMKGAILVNYSILNGIIYQGAILDSETDVLKTFQSEDLKQNNKEFLDCLKALNAPDKFITYLDSESLQVEISENITLLNLKAYSNLHNIKFPYSCSDDLDIIALRSLRGDYYNSLPVVNFSLQEISSLVFFNKDFKDKATFLKHMQDACTRPLLILNNLKKMTLLKI